VAVRQLEGNLSCRHSKERLANIQKGVVGWAHHRGACLSRRKGSNQGKSCPCLVRGSGAVVFLGTFWEGDTGCLYLPKPNRLDNNIELRKSSTTTTRNFTPGVQIYVMDEQASQGGKKGSAPYRKNTSPSRQEAKALHLIVQPATE